MMARGLRVGIFANMIWSMDVRGTARNIPGIPQMKPQRERESRITSGERLSCTPWSLGSIMLPSTISIEVFSRATYSMIAHLGENWIIAIKMVRTVAIMEPIFGMKFKMKAAIPQTIGKSSPVMRADR